MGFIYLFGLIALLAVIILFVIAGTVISGIFRGFTSIFNRNSKHYGADERGGKKERRYTSQEKRSKIFGPNDGEYVEFEEIKEDDKKH